MKRLTLILAALALTLSLSQCKKTETPTTDEGIFITLKAGYGNGAKTDFAPATGAFVWTEDAMEYIYVGGSNHSDCLGVLSGTGNGMVSMTFSGALTTTPDAGETLYFFYLGKGRDGSAVSTLNFSSQDGTLENVTNYHIAISEGVEYAGQTSFSTTLNMKMAIAYFDVNGFKNANDAAETVYLHGDEVYSSATIDYTNGTITGETKGYINLGTANNGKYVALIPSVSTETTLKFDSNSKWGAMNFLRGIQAGRYYSNSGAALTVTAGALLEGTVPGLFSVSATKMVRFSKGNLQYQGSTQTWRFAENQYNFVGGVNESGFDPDHQQYGNVFEGEVQCKNELIAPDYSGWIDLFGWGTKNNPTTYDVDGTYSWNEWGENAISNGGNTENSGWCTLTVGEWTWLVGSTMGSDPGTNCRISSTVNNTANARYTNAILNINSTSSVNGIILFPDDYTAGTPEGITWGPINEKSNWGTSCTISGWATLEAAGCVFLPASGYRKGISVGYANSRGMYWSSSNTGSGAGYAWYFDFNKDSVNPQNYGGQGEGRSVRLVHNAGLIVDNDIVNDVTAGGSIFSGWTNGGGNPWEEPTPGSGGSTLGGWNNDGNDPWGN